MVWFYGIKSIVHYDFECDEGIFLEIMRLEADDTINKEQDKSQEGKMRGG